MAMRVLSAAAILASAEAISPFNSGYPGHSGYSGYPSSGYPSSGYPSSGYPGYGFPGYGSYPGWQFGMGSTPSPWVDSPSSQWTTPTDTSSTSTSLLPSQTLAGRSPSEQLQITKCRTGQTCEKCRQLNCYWDASAKITNRCIALGLESTQIPVDQGIASNLGQCPAYGQTGSMGVNWLAIEASGAQVPRLDGMSDADVYRWISGLPNYQPDAAEVNYPAGSAFRELLPNAAAQYQSGKIPTTTPWISFWDSLNGYGSYGYDDSYPGYGYSFPNPMTPYPPAWNNFGNPSYPGFGGQASFAVPNFPGPAPFPGSLPSSIPGSIPSFGAAIPPAGFPPAGFPPAGFPPAGVPPAGVPPAGFPPAGLTDFSGFPTSTLPAIPSYPSQPLAG